MNRPTKEQVERAFECHRDCSFDVCDTAVLHAEVRALRSIIERVQVVARRRVWTDQTGEVNSDEELDEALEFETGEVSS